MTGQLTDEQWAQKNAEIIARSMAIPGHTVSPYPIRDRFLEAIRRGREQEREQIIASICSMPDLNDGAGYVIAEQEITRMIYARGEAKAPSTNKT